jgi:hypothetical protein
MVEDRVLLRDTRRYQCANVFIVRPCLKMNCPDLCPVEDAIGQPVLQIAKARRFSGSLKLGVTDDQLRASLASSSGEDRVRLKQAIRHGVGKVGALDALESRANRGRVKRITGKPRSNKRFVTLRPVEPSGPPAAPETKIGFDVSSPFGRRLLPHPAHKMIYVSLSIQPLTGEAILPYRPRESKATQQKISCALVRAFIMAPHSSRRRYASHCGWRRKLRRQAAVFLAESTNHVYLLVRSGGNWASFTLS